MNDTYSDFNIIPIGDHCAISIILKEINLRCKSYPFDWITNIEPLHDSNIMYNINIIHKLKSDENIQNIVKDFIGDAFENENKVNSNNNIWFPHDTENIIDIFKKYERRFNRLNEDLNKKNIFILLTRHYYIDEDVFQKIMEILLSFNSDNKILFISGTNHAYFENIKYESVIFKHIYYDILQFYDYDYTSFRPNLKIFLSNLLL